MSSQISTAATYSSQCARLLLSTLLQSLQRRHKPSLENPILLFAFAPSSTTPPEVVSHIISTLTQLYPKHVGCISAPLPHQYLDPKMHCEPYPCSLAYAFVNGVSFRSTISGPAETRVGRWHAGREQIAEDSDARKAIPSNTEDSRIQTLSDLSESGGKINWEHVWDRRTATSALHGNGLGSETLPNGLRNIDPFAIDNIFYFSDKAPEGLATVLQDTFPHANKFSLIASSTPFVTGRPVTLFYNGSISSDGAVGIAFTSSPLSPPPAVELSFPPLIALSRNLNVTSSEGNLILSLDSGNPTQLLLNAIRKHGISSSHTTWVGKEDEFYVGVMDPSTQQVSQLHRINAGDPSRGGVALDAASAPREGSIVRLYHLPKDPVPDAAPACVSDTIPNNILLLVAPEMAPAASFGGGIANDLAPADDRLVVSNAFLAASENGFTLSRGTQGHWKCAVPGGRVRWSL